MSEENVEIVRRVFEAAASGDTATVLGLYDPEVEVDNTHDPMAALVGGESVLHGHEGLRTFWREWYEAWENAEPNLEELIEVGDQVISFVTSRGRGRASGVEVEMAQYAVWTIWEGRVVRVVWSPTREEALEAAGLQE